MEKILSNIVDAYWNTTIGDVHIFVFLTITVIALIILYKPLKICYKIQKELEPIDWDGVMDSEEEIKEKEETSSSSGVPNIFSCIHDFSDIKSGGESSIIAITGRCSGVNNRGKSSVAASTGSTSLANNNAQNSIVASTGENTVANSCGQSSIVASTGRTYGSKQLWREFCLCKHRKFFYIHKYRGRFCGNSNWYRIVRKGE